ncbi:putative COP9 signalosome complex subunit 6 [Hypsibius exemplaris]|uniref:COP9 signalosome complex subunit 6 n=1 Tax=Hypsibius exemplaris TaxID=2072580 RepID=A0A1W0WHD9_HYPEX|nr:putative COP9 signalosome complex subunit 6 [Hypsibius exemplaris]
MAGTSAAKQLGVKRTPLNENDAKTLLASSSKTSATEVDLHPVVLLHIADHHHRNVAQHGGRSQVFGALLGRQDGPKAEICFAFEILVKSEGGRNVLDKAYWLEKEEQFKQILPGLDYIGWYTVSDEFLTMQDLDMQNQMWEVSQNPFLLKARGNKPDSFPVDLFESVIEFESGAPKVKFIPLTYNIVFEQAEQIGVHHIATKADAESAESAVAETEYQISMRTMSSAIRMLQERLVMVCKYLSDVDAGVMPPDEAVLVEMKRIVDMLEHLQSDEQTEKLNILKLQAVMTASVGNYAQSVESLLDFVRKSVLLVDRRGHQKGFSRMMMGSGFGRGGMMGGGGGGGGGGGSQRMTKLIKPSTTRQRAGRFFGMGGGSSNSNKSFDADESKGSGSQNSENMSP